MRDPSYTSGPAGSGNTGVSDATTATAFGAGTDTTDGGGLLDRLARVNTSVMKADSPEPPDGAPADK